jgi:hypothetical protein
LVSRQRPRGREIFFDDLIFASGVDVCVAHLIVRSIHRRP